MNTQVGERYQCTDSNCGCEVQVTSASRAQDESSMGNTSSRPVGGMATGETGVGTLRNAEQSGISTPGDFGSQGATGEGVFGTSGGNQRSTSSGRLGSTTGALHSGRTGAPAQSASSERSSASEETMRMSASGEQVTFYCCCGQPMRKTSASQVYSRAAQA
jgi:hypothetical protein